MYKAVIFDFEGTLVNFAWDKENAVNEVKGILEKNDIDAVGNYAELYNLVSSRYPHIRNELDRIYDRYDLKALENWKLKNEVFDILSKIEAKKAVVSNVNGDLLRKVLENFEVSKFFLLVIGRKDVELLKPSDAGLKLALKKLGVESHEVLFVGDSISDVMACRNAGVDIAVVEGENRVDELDADYRLSSLSDILSLPVHGL